MKSAIFLLIGSLIPYVAVKKACPFSPADIIFVVDASGSVGKDNFQKELNFISKFIEQFQVGPKNAQIGLIVFSTNVKAEFFLNQYQTEDEVLAAVKRPIYMDGETYLNRALDYVHYACLDANHGARPDISKIIIVITDGQSNDADLTVTAASNLKKMAHVSVFAIGIGSEVDKDQLKAIATDDKHMFQVLSFDALNTIHHDLTDMACMVCRNVQADIFFVLDSSGSQGVDNFASQLQFIAMVAEEFEFGPGEAQFGVITFATTSELEIGFDDYNDKDEFLNKVLNITFKNGETNTHSGLKLALQYFRDSRRGARLLSKRFCIILTDGRSTEEVSTRKAADDLHSYGIETFAIGIGRNVDLMELRSMASDPRYLFLVGSFSELSTLRETVAEAICAKKS